VLVDTKKVAVGSIYLLSKRVGNHFRKYIYSVGVVSKHFLWHAVVHPKIAGFWMLRILGENDWLTYHDSLIPKMEPIEIIPDVDEQKFYLSNCLSEDISSISPRELLFISAMLVYLKPKTVFEFGTSLGRTTYHIALNTPVDAVIYSLDLPPISAKSQVTTGYAVCPNERHMMLNDRAQVVFNNKPEAYKIRQIFCDSANFKVDCLRQTMDFIFIDGSHSYEYVKNDSEKAFEMLRPGGTVVWHDFTNGCQWPGVSRYLKELAKRKKLVRVSRTNLAVYRDEI